MRAKKGQGGLGHECPKSKLSFVKHGTVPSFVLCLTSVTPNQTSTQEECCDSSIVPMWNHTFTCPRSHSQSLMELIIDTEPTSLIATSLREGESMGRERQQTSLTEGKHGFAKG